MYSRIGRGKKVSISNKNYRKLLKRFDPGNFTLSPASNFKQALMISNTPCSLCATFRRVVSRDPLMVKTACGRCPLASFETIYSGCVAVLKQVTESYWIYMNVERVTYEPIYAARAVPELEAIMKFLKSFKKE